MDKRVTLYLNDKHCPFASNQIAMMGILTSIKKCVLNYVFEMFVNHAKSINDEQRKQTASSNHAHNGREHDTLPFIEKQAMS